jgi:hypothetical protein
MSTKSKSLDSGPPPDSSVKRVNPLLGSVVAMTVNISLLLLSYIIDRAYLGKNPPSRASQVEHDVMRGIYLISIGGIAISILSVTLALLSNRKGVTRTFCTLGGGTALLLWIFIFLVVSEFLNIYSVFH